MDGNSLSEKKNKLSQESNKISPTLFAFEIKKAESLRKDIISNPFVISTITSQRYNSLLHRKFILSVFIFYSKSNYSLFSYRTWMRNILVLLNGIENMGERKNQLLRYTIIGNWRNKRKLKAKVGKIIQEESSIPPPPLHLPPPRRFNEYSSEELPLHKLKTFSCRNIPISSFFYFRENPRFYKCTSCYHYTINGILL